MFRFAIIAFALAGCGKDNGPKSGSNPVDLTQILGAGEVRAGVVTDENALFGGISAEGGAGDFKIYNDRIQFVIQGKREGDYYVQSGGMVVDADIVRPPGQPGRDIADEWGVMFGFGRLLEPTKIEVIRDGTMGGPAVIRVTGDEVPLRLIEGALELPGFVEMYGLTMTTEYRLYPDSWLMEVHSSVTANDGPVERLAIGDIIMGGPEAAQTWSQGIGMGEETGDPRLWSGYVGKRNDVAIALVAGLDDPMSAAGVELFSSLVDLVLGFGADADLEEGDTLSSVRFYGVGPDLATISDAALAAHGIETESAAGTVTAPDGPVAGARVNILVDNTPYTVAFTNSEGAFSAEVPAGSTHSALAVGRGEGIFVDHPDGAAPHSPYSAPPVADLSLQALADGAEPVPWAQGRGFASAADPLTLSEPAKLTVAVADGLPFTVQLRFTEADPEVDEALIPDRTSGYAAAGWSRDGAVTLLAEPGTYDLVVHRGMRYEIHLETVDLVGGSELAITADLGAAYDHSGWLLGDPHSHASPSGDGEITMEDRLTVAAGNGIQVHFGTDHDHIADYRPLVGALGLSTVLATVVSDEVSPPFRGHMNIYPVEPLSDRGNNGAFGWWYEPIVDTAGMFEDLRARHGDDFIIQSNHPTDSGLASSAQWSAGIIGVADRWSTDFQAVEVLNAGSLEGLEFFLDVIARGQHATAVGVSDSHSHFSGGVGFNGTFIDFGTDDPAAYTDEALRDAMWGQRTIATRGPFLDLSVKPGSTVSGGTAVDVEARSPSWIVVDRLELFQDGLLVDTIPSSSGQFLLDPMSDASFTIVATGDTPMQPVYSRTPWATTSPIYVDVDGGGWTPPLPPLTVVP